MPKRDKLTNYPADFRVLIRAIMEYESDTFSASGTELTMKEAYKMARAMVKSIALQLGYSIDGVMLSEILELVRTSKRGE